METTLNGKGTVPESAPMAVDGNGSALPQNGAASRTSDGISADEIALYDRQIRLWGMKAQEKIRNASVLLITMRALANEIAKNLVLAGINSITVIDPSPVTETDQAAQFLLPTEPSPVGMNRAQASSANLQKLNPRVRVTYDSTSIASKSPSFFTPFTVVIATDLDPIALNVINTATRLHGIPFYAASAHGLYAYAFADLISHDFSIEREASNKTTPPGTAETRTCSIISVQKKTSDTGKPVELVTKRELYSTFTLSEAARLPSEFYSHRRRLKAVTPALPCFRALWEFQTQNGGRLPNTTAKEDIEAFTRLATEKKTALGLNEELKSEFLRSFLQGIGTEISPVAAVVGGQIAQDVINVLGGTQQPIQNLLIFDGDRMDASVYALHPEGPLGEELLKTADGGLVQAAAAAAATATAPIMGAGQEVEVVVL